MDDIDVIFDQVNKKKKGQPPVIKQERKKKKVIDVPFTDSRGSQTRRTTEEGFPIYKEHELGMSDKGGDTPLCPFDCQCCF